MEKQHCEGLGGGSVWATAVRPARLSGQQGARRGEKKLDAVGGLEDQAEEI